MATTIRLTKPKNNEPVGVNFDNVAYYKPRQKYTEIVFASPNHYEQTVVVKETMNKWTGYWGYKQQSKP